MSGARGEPPRTGAGGEARDASEAGGSFATTRNLVILLVVAALIRIAGIWGPGHLGDIRAFEMWAEGVAQHGLGGYYAAGGDSNYPPMLYLLWPLGLSLDGGDLWFAIRLLSIPFDLALGALLFFVVRSRTDRERDGILASGFYLLNPAVVLCGPAWGQVDGMGALPMVAALVAVARGRVATAGVLAVLAGLVKPQFGAAAFVLAGLALFWLRSAEGVRRAALMALGGLITFAAVLLPLGLGPVSYLDLMGETFRRYSVHSGFAFNPWGAVFGFNHQDGAWFYVGTVLEVAAIGASLWLLRWRRDLVGLLAVGSLIALTLYFVPTRAHERYLYGAIALLAPLAVLDRGLRWPFISLSAMFFATLAYVLASSPYRILPGEKIEGFPDLVITIMSV
ncbi:MAG TPA: glycosyltransferase 87 family protein, partial [Candidatus Limnocylindria bacterium]|nr:glycosyltransferase 87 family protein [Candidatus Limnocylindria bacterium]